MQFDDVVSRLVDRLGGPLPGTRAQAILGPEPLRRWPEGFDHATIRHAAGLLLVFPIENRPHIVLTIRAGTLERHSGQISLPGGAVDPGETPEQAALREAHEEVALPSGEARILGSLTPVDIPISGFRLHPVVAVMSRRPELRAADGEVASILEIAVDTLLDRACLVTVRRERDGHALVVPAFRVGNQEIWGATAMVLAEFLVLLDWDPQLS